MDIADILQAGVLLVAVGASWGGARVALNGTKKKVDKLETAKNDMIDRLARIETKLDILMRKN